MTVTILITITTTVIDLTNYHHSASFQAVDLKFGMEVSKTVFYDNNVNDDDDDINNVDNNNKNYKS